MELGNNRFLQQAKKAIPFDLLRGPERMARISKIPNGIRNFVSMNKRMTEKTLRGIREVDERKENNSESINKFATKRWGSQLAHRREKHTPLDKEDEELVTQFLESSSDLKHADMAFYEYIDFDKGQAKGINESLFKFGKELIDRLRGRTEIEKVLGSTALDRGLASQPRSRTHDAYPALTRQLTTSAEEMEYLGASDVIDLRTPPYKQLEIPLETESEDQRYAQVRED